MLLELLGIDSAELVKSSRVEVPKDQENPFEETLKENIGSLPIYRFANKHFFHFWTIFIFSRPRGTQQKKLQNLDSRQFQQKREKQ